MKVVAAVQRQCWIAAPGRQPRVAGRKEKTADVVRGEAVRIGDAREIKRARPFGPDREQRGARARCGDQRVELRGPLAKIDAALVQRGRSLLQDDNRSEEHTSEL